MVEHPCIRISRGTLQWFIKNPAAQAELSEHFDAFLKHFEKLNRRHPCAEYRQLIDQIGGAVADPHNLAALLQAILAEHERNLRARWDRRKQERDRLDGVLGNDCPRLERRLYCVLEREPWEDWLPREPIPEAEVVELIYHVDWENASPRRRASVRTSLRKLQQRLNARLKRQRTPFAVNRPRPGKLLLTGYTPAPAPPGLDRLVAHAPRGDELFETLLQLLTPDGIAWVLRNSPDWALAQILIGPAKVRAAQLENEWRALGGSPKALRKALTRLSVQRHREGGRHGQAWVSLPAGFPGLDRGKLEAVLSHIIEAIELFPRTGNVTERASVKNAAKTALA